MLFQPKNDHLLFAYFGFSLQTRRRSLKTEVRSRLATKRKALRYLHPEQVVLIRDATDDRYPYLDTDKSKQRVERGRWITLTFKGHFSDGLHFVCARHFAYLGDDGEKWDYAECMDDGPVHSRNNPWRENDDHDDHEARSAAMAIWGALPGLNKAWYEVLAVLPYENILDIDEKGDEYGSNPHIYTTEFVLSTGPFCYFLFSLETILNYEARSGEAEEDKRIEKFPRLDPKTHTMPNSLG